MSLLAFKTTASLVTTIFHVQVEYVRLGAFRNIHYQVCRLSCNLEEVLDVFSKAPSINVGRNVFGLLSPPSVQLAQINYSLPESKSII